jgi:quercetin dioxygenase-like cupin family protein
MEITATKFVALPSDPPLARAEQGDENGFTQIAATPFPGETMGGKLAMGEGIVVKPGDGPVSSFTPGRSIAIKLPGAETGGSIMLFEETVPAGTRSTFHRHRDSDEVAYVLSGEVTFKIGDEVTVGGPGACAFMPRGVPHAWKSTGAETGRVLFLYTPAKAGRLIEEQQRTGRKFASMNERELAEFLDRHGWEILGPSPL